MSGTNQSWSRARFWLVGLSAFWLTFAGVGQEVPEEKMQQLLRRFPTADLNKDGKLTREELLRFRGKARAPTSTSAATEIPSRAPTTRAAGKVEIRVTSDKPVPINPKIYGINCAEMF